MSSEQVLLTKWRNLSQEKQKQVLDFLDFMSWKDGTSKPFPGKADFEKRLEQIRTKITSYSNQS